MTSRTRIMLATGVWIAEQLALPLMVAVMAWWAFAIVDGIAGVVVKLRST